MKKSINLCAFTQGVMAIPVTPFERDGEIDVGALREMVSLLAHNGANAIVGPAFVSEFYALTDTEYNAFIENVAEVCDKVKIPFVAGVSAPSTYQAAVKAEIAADSASMVLAMPPYVIAPTREELTQHYSEVVRSFSNGPVMIQNAPQPAGVQLSADALLQLIQTIDADVWVKEETLNAPDIIGALENNRPSNYMGCVGGVGGQYLLEEILRGSKGTMPAGEFVDLHSRLWEEIGNNGVFSDKAIEMFNSLLPLIMLERRYGISFCKEVFRMRGLSISNVCREPNSQEIPSEVTKLIRYQLEVACDIYGVDLAI